MVLARAAKSLPRVTVTVIAAPHLGAQGWTRTSRQKTWRHLNRRPPENARLRADAHDSAAWCDLQPARLSSPGWLMPSTTQPTHVSGTLTADFGSPSPPPNQPGSVGVAPARHASR